MDTTQLRAELAQQKAAMTAYNVERRQAEAARRWVTLGGSEAAFARVDARLFMSLNEQQQKFLVQSMEQAE